MPEPQRIDFGQGKSRTVASTVSATISAAGRPGLVVTAKKTRALPASRSSSWSRVRPVERRKPSMRGGGGVGARTLALLADRERGVGEALDGEGQAARRGEGGGVGVGQAAGDEAVGDEALEVVGGPRLHPGRDFLGEELEQEVRHRSVLALALRAWKSGKRVDLEGRKKRAG